MAILKAKTLRDLSIEELEANLQDIRREQYNLVNEYRISRKLAKPHELRQARRNKARILTVLQQKRTDFKGQAR